ncbi:MAG: SH3 domain-containing protein [Desulfocapsaceae bacterium]|nr:SH3 domain-containing protein [Desulfocapsaceae bacterium]
MRKKRYLVIQDYSSEYPNPITFAKGASLVVGKKYEGPEDWNDWFFCSTPGQDSGWVPAQIIEIINGNIARAREDYTARELNVQKGDLLLGLKTLNGWVWCENPASSESGWVPIVNLQEINQ